MGETHSAAALPYVLVKVRARLSGLPSQDVVETVSLSEISGVPQVPSHVRGVLNLPGRVLPLASQLKKIDAPHRRIHLRGAEALACAARGEHDRASALRRDIRESDRLEAFAAESSGRLVSSIRKRARDEQLVMSLTPRASWRLSGVCVAGVGPFDLA